MTTHTDTTATPDRAELRKFGLIFGSLIIGAFGLLIPWIWDLEIAVTKWPWPLGGLFILWGLLHPASLAPVYRGWMRIGLLIGKIMTPVILTLVYVIAVIPTAMILRISGKDLLHRDFDDSPSYRVESKEPSIDNLEKPF